MKCPASRDDLARRLRHPDRDRPLVDRRGFSPFGERRRGPVPQIRCWEKERAMLWLVCRRCAGRFRTPVIVALCPYCQGERTLDGSTGTWKD
jgi:hypothetical protein